MHALQNCKVWDLVFFPRFIWLLKLKVTLAELCLLCPHNAGSDCQEFVFLPIPPRWWLHFSKVFQCFHPTKWGTWAFGVPKNLSENLQCQTMFISNTEMLSAFSLSSHSQWWYRIDCGVTSGLQNKLRQWCPPALPSATPHTHKKKAVS